LQTLTVCVLRHYIPDTDESSLVAAQFKKAFEDARENNSKLASTTSASALDKSEETVESKDEDEEDANSPEHGETNPPVAGEGENTEED
jgi:hypothetical protein